MIMMIDDWMFHVWKFHEVNLREATQTNLKELKESLYKESKEASLAGWSFGSSKLFTFDKGPPAEK